MRFQEHIDESVSTGAWEALRKMLEKNCMPYIKQLKDCDSMLIRGSKKSIKMFDKITQRQDRKPALIGRELAVIMDDWTNDHWGFRARTQAAFATNKLHTSKAYGSAYMFFPIGDFKYAWNQDVSNLYGSYDNFEPMVYMNFERVNTNSTSKSEEITKEESRQQMFDQNIVPDLKEYTVNKGLNNYLKGRHWNEAGYSECIVKCKSYYLVNIEWDTHLLVWFTSRFWKQ